MRSRERSKNFFRTRIFTPASPPPVSAARRTSTSAKPPPPTCASTRKREIAPKENNLAKKCAIWRMRRRNAPHASSQCAPRGAAFFLLPSVRGGRNCPRSEVSNVARSRRNSSRFEESFVYAGCRRILSKRGLAKCQMFAGVSAIARRVAQEGHDLRPEPRRRRFHGAAFRRIHEANDAEFGGMRAIYCKL